MPCRIGKRPPAQEKKNSRPSRSRRWKVRAVPLFGKRPPAPRKPKGNQDGHSSERVVEGQEINKGPATLQQCAKRPGFVRLACGGYARGWLRCVPLLFFLNTKIKITNRFIYKATAPAAAPPPPRRRPAAAPPPHRPPPPHRRRRREPSTAERRVAAVVLRVRMCAQHPQAH